MAHVLAQDLRNAVLQAAFEGKLTTQNVNDTPAYRTLHTISQLKKELKIKDAKQSESVDPPFDIPEAWQWVKMQEVIDVRDGTHDSPQYVTEGYPFITSKNLVNGKINFDNVKYIQEKDFLKFNERSKVEENDILMAMIGSIGKPVLIENKDREFSIKNVALLKHIPGSEINMKYVLHLMNYAEANMKSQATGGVQQFVSLNYLRNYPFPLSPIEEQARIVARVDELMAKIDEYEKIEKQLTELKKSFPGKMKDAILQAAMQGKLTDQLESDEPLIQLKERLVIDSKIKEPEDYPFDIPDCWEWMPIGSLGNSLGTDSFSDGPFGSNLKREHQISDPEVRIIQLSNIGENGWRDENVKYTSHKHLDNVIPRCEIKPGDFAIAKMMPAGRTIEVPDLGTRITLGSDTMKFVPNDNLNKRYLLYAMHSAVFIDQVYSEAHGITRVRTTLNGVKSYVLPIPPIEEQQRIVEKLDQLLPLCDSLESMS